jgi:Flp pilus assembly protein TadB
VLGICACATFTLVWCLADRAALPASRLRPGAGSSDSRAGPRPAASTRTSRSVVEDAGRRLALCLAACTAAAWLLGGSLLVVCGVPAGVALSWWLGRLESPSQAFERDAIARDLPLAAELLAACVAVGRPVDDGLRLVSRAIGGPLGSRLDSVATRLALGADPLTEWRRATADPQLAPFARTMARTLASGAPVGDALTRLAEDRRRERRTETQLRARNVGVKAAGPLAACFLPAFMLVGIVPTIASAFARLVL